MRFDYLHPARTLLLRRVLEVRIPQRFHTALCALFAALTVIAGTCAIEAYRLHQALRVEASYRQRYDRTQRALREADVYYKQVRMAVRLDRRVRAIAASGDEDARTLAEIANRLPDHVWLTGIGRDATGLALEGRAKDLAVLSTVMRNFGRAQRLHSPTLLGASLDSQRGRNAVVTYEIHVESAAQ